MISAAKPPLSPTCSTGPHERSEPAHHLRASLVNIVATEPDVGVRYGYRRVHVLLRREGWAVNPQRFHRLYKEMDLQLRNKTPKRRVKAYLPEDRASWPSGR